MRAARRLQRDDNGIFSPRGGDRVYVRLCTLSDTNYYRALYDYYRSEAGYLYALGKNLKDEYGR